MYTKDDSTRLQKVSVSFLKELEKGIPENKIESLRNALRFHEYRYYILNDPLISDYEYDQLFKALEKLGTLN
jgi:DNA ligase (NAD+)